MPEPDPETGFEDRGDQRIDDEELTARALELAWDGFLVASKRSLRSAPCPSSAMRTRRSPSGFRSERCALAPTGRVPACRNSIPVSDIKEEDRMQVIKEADEAMKGDFSIPPLHDLPPGRLAQRREHLLFEITHAGESRGARARSWPSRWGRPGQRRLLVLAVAALVAVVGTASAFGTVRDFFLDRGFIGLPPLGATPSTPESGELKIFYRGER